MSEVDDATPSRIPADEARQVPSNFITDIIDDDLASGRRRRVVTRFPPEPNGYAHIGHAYASFLDFGVADDYGGVCNLRFDDTNPEVEEMEYVRSIEADLRWLGFRWDGEIRFASDYFEQLYGFAERLIEMGKAYVDSLSGDEIRAYRGSVDEAGRNSPYRDRSVEENLDLFRRMRAGEFENGEHVLRARIDMASPNMKMRDPLLYRIVHHDHYRTGGDWCIYPFYDFQHPLSDAIEGVTHSLCSLEFVDNREVYDWLVDALFPDRERPYQYEFGRRSLEYTVVSKRKLIELVRRGHVDGWDDPRMPTLAGLRRRGVRPEAIRDFAARIGVSRTNRTVDIALLEYAIRDDLNTEAPRVMAVLEPLKVVLTNLGEAEARELRAPYFPPDVGRAGERTVTLTREILIERSDFAEDPPKGFRRLSPGSSVRLRHAYIVTCDEVVRDAAGEVAELRCRVHLDSLGTTPDGVRVGGAIHWVSAPHALEAEFRLYDRLFEVPDPDAADGSFLDHLTPDSLEVRRGVVEPSVADDPADTRYQFERLGYFWRDPEVSTPEAPVFNRIVTLKDTWGRKIQVPPAKLEATGELPEVKVGRTPPAKAGEEPDPVELLSIDGRIRFEALRESHDLSRDDAALIAADAELHAFFAATVGAGADGGQTANWIVNELQRVLKDRPLGELPLEPDALAELLGLIDDGTISARAGKDVFEAVLAGEGRPGAIVEARGLRQLSDDAALEALVERVLDAHPDKVAEYHGGKTGLIGFFVGQAMRESGGKANPQRVKELLNAALEG